MDKKQVSTPSISLPQGGGAIKGIGETFQTGAFTGTGKLSLPVRLSPVRGAEPSLSLNYDSGSGNGVFGLGFSLVLPSISRRTDTGVPRYNNTDTFALSGDENLVVKLVATAEGLLPDIRYEDVDGVQWEVTSYMPRVEGSFASIEQWSSQASAQDVYWKVVTSKNLTTYYGRSEQARIADPGNPTRIFSWLPEQSFDAQGNKILYKYKRENGVNVPPSIYEQDREISANRYIESIHYGNYIDTKGEEQFAFDVVFDYGEYNLEHPDEQPGEWTVRQDPFSSYRAGFEIRTLRLCRGILQYQQFENELDGQRFLVRAMELMYDQTPIFSFLKSAQVVGFRLRSDGTYERKSLPPVEFSYSPFQPADQEFRTLVVDGDFTIPGNPSTRQLQSVDLYGEGIPGFLCSNEVVTLYWEPQGQGHYTIPEPPLYFPIEKNLENPSYSLIDIDGNGRLDLMVETPMRTGFYGNDNTGAWLPFRSFSSYPLAGFDASSTMADLTGGGRSDIVWLQRGKVTMYPSESVLGFGPPVISVLESGFPLESSPGELVLFADIFGDGMAHRVRISNGTVECWPGLGYGHFGPPVRLANAPHLGEDFDPSRILLADVDGSGTTDILYVYSDRVDVYLNCSGNSFAEPVSIRLPEPYSSIDSVQVADITGSGTACLLFSKMDGEVRHYYYSFAGTRTGSTEQDSNEVKPYLLCEMNNNMGTSTRVSYVSSTKFYLADKLAGRPWLTRLPFPVQVVDTVESLDLISGSKAINRYSYHDGYYDPIEREFRGFGYVEEWESLTFEEYINSNLHPGMAFRTGSAELHEPAAYTRTWYHTGAYMEAGVLSRQYATEYYKGDPLEYSMPDSVLCPDIYESGPQTIREACAALKGQELRKEVYGLDNSALEDIPYRVSESNYEVRMYQPCYADQPAVFLVVGRENITYDYEREPADPRTQHVFTLETDEFGNILLSSQVMYSRRENTVVANNPVFDIYPEQLKMEVLVDTSSYINVVEGFRLIGTVYEQVKSELSGLDLDGQMYFSFDQIDTQVKAALLNSIPYGTAFSPGELQSRAYSCKRSYFWNEEQTAALPLGSITSRALSHHGSTAVFPPSMVESVYGGRVTDDMLISNGYVLEDGYWWNPGSISVFSTGEEKFFLLEKILDPLGGHTEMEYDAYRLNIIRTAQLAGTTSDGDITNVVSASIDYQVLQPWEVVNINNIVNQLLFDPLGFVIAMTVFGDVDGQRQGDSPIDEYVRRGPATFNDVVLDQPEYYLQQATGYYYYDLDAWRDRGEPLCTATLMRETYVSELPVGTETRIRKTIEYIDGFGRTIEQVGNAAPCDEQSSAEEIWVVSGRTVYNNKSNPVEQYFNYYTAEPYFSPDDVLCGTMPIPTTTRYDAMGRAVRVNTPKGFFTATEYHAWTRIQYDEDDTVKDSIYYKDHINDTDPAFQDELNALEKAAVFFDTPAGTALDTMGREFLWVVINVQQDVSSDSADILGPFYLSTKAGLDVQGNVLSMTDPRLGTLSPPVPNVAQVYDMVAEQLFIHSVDSGDRSLFYNVFGNEATRWDSRNITTSTRYDILQRVVEVHAAGTDPLNELELNQVVERVVYGESVEESQAKNLRGEVYCYYDEAGTVTSPLYNIERKAIQSIRQYRRDYRTEVNWDVPSEVPMLEEQFLTETAYNAVGNQTSETTPQAGTLHFAYTINGWSDSLNVEFPDGSTENIITSILYQADGQASQINRGNGVKSTHTYEPTTQRLLGIVSVRPEAPDGSVLSEVLQDIVYTYDPMGNVTRIRDYTQQTVFCDQQEVEALSDYTYDALYRLIQATGRQHPGIQANTHITGFKQTLYMPLCPQPHPNDMEKLQNYREVYTYDNSSNLTKLSHYAPSQSWTRLVIVPADSNRAVPADSPQTTYDGAGNMLALDNIPAMRWSWRNMLASAAVIVRDQEGDDDADYYAYDYAGQRVRKDIDRFTFGGDVTDRRETLYLGRQIIYRTYRSSDSGETLVDERISLHASDGNTRFAIIDTATVVNHLLPSAQQEGVRQTRYQLDNNLGSSVVEVDGSANVISYEEFFPFGGTSVIAGNSMVEVSPKVYRYSGKEADDSTGLYYYGARYYISWLGRWTSPDPAGPVDGLNFYAFVGNNPVSFADVGGLGRARIVSWNIRGTAENNNAMRRNKARRLARLFNNHNVDIIVLQEAGSTIRRFKRSLRSRLTPGTRIKFLHSGSKPPSGTIGTTRFTAEGRQDHYLIIYNKANIRRVTPRGFPDYPNDANIVGAYNARNFRTRDEFASRLGHRRPFEFQVRLKPGAPGVAANTNAERDLSLFTWHAPEGGGGKRDALPGIQLFNSSSHLTNLTGGNTPFALAGDLNATGPNVSGALSNFQGISRVSQGNWDHIVGSSLTNTQDAGLNGELTATTALGLSDHPLVGSDLTWH